MDASKESASQSVLLGHSNDKHQNDLNIKLFDVRCLNDECRNDKNVKAVCSLTFKWQMSK